MQKETNRHFGLFKGSSKPKLEPDASMKVSITPTENTIRDVTIRGPIQIAHDVFSELNLHVARETADYAIRHLDRALHFYHVQHLWSHALTNVYKPGIWAEFGVFKGTSINFFARSRPKQKIYGFDSFEGLHVDWKGTHMPKGSFDLKGNLPPVEANVELVKGWFDETLPAFLSEVRDEFGFLHIDCDTYEGCKIILDLAGSRITAGTIIVFDEYFGYRGWRHGEHKAWLEFTKRTHMKYEYLAFCHQQVSVRVL